MTLVATILREQKLYLLGNKTNYKLKATPFRWPLFILFSPSFISYYFRQNAQKRAFLPYSHRLFSAIGKETDFLTSSLITRAASPFSLYLALFLSELTFC